jgi:cytochrome c
MKHTVLSSLAIVLVTMTTAFAEDLENGRQLFRNCVSCHNVDSDRNKFGPHLKGIVGRHAGAAADYQYSQAMQAAGAAGLVWDETTLAEFLADPQQKVPGTRMRFWGMKPGSDMDDLIGYLKAYP